MKRTLVWVAAFLILLIVTRQQGAAHAHFRVLSDWNFKSNKGNGLIELVQISTFLKWR